MSHPDQVDPVVVAGVQHRVSAEQPSRQLGVLHAAAVCVGMVIGAGIFKTAPMVAASLDSPAAVLAAWGLGGLAAIIGALCFAEMAVAFPDAGGDYRFLRLAYGRHVGFLFAWSRFAVIHTGSMALLAFVFGDYLAQVIDLGPYTSTVLAATAIASLVTINLAGMRIGFATQIVLTGVVLVGLLAVAAAGGWLAWHGVAAPLPRAPGGAVDGPLGLGSAMVFVSLAYGGWSDTATLSSEMRDPHRGIRRALTLGICTVAALYLLANWAYLRGLGLDGLAGSRAPAADLMLRAFGRPGEYLIVAAVATTSVAVMNALLISGARTTYAAARDLAAARSTAVATPPQAPPAGALQRLATWDPMHGGPATAIVAMGCVALALVAFGAWTRGGFTTMVDYLSPVYWMFLVASGFAVLRLRQRHPDVPRPYRVPLYPVLPLLFCASSAYVFYASVAYVKAGAVASLAVLAAGALVLAALQRPSGRT